MTIAGYQNGDIVHDASGLFTPDSVLSGGPAGTSTVTAYETLQWQSGTFQPWFVINEVKHSGGKYGNQWGIAFLGTGSQSTVAVSPKTGSVFQYEQSVGHVHILKTNGTTATLSGVVMSLLAIDDITGNFASVALAKNSQINAYDESGNLKCHLNLAMPLISSISARGGYMVFTDPVDSLVGVAKMSTSSLDETCDGYHTMSLAGQPWSVAMTNGAELDAYVLSRDTFSNGLPGLTKVVVNADGTLKSTGSVELTGFTPVSTVRADAAGKYAGIYQVAAFSSTATVAVLFMSDPNDGLVLTISTDTSSGKTMKIAHSTPVAELPIGIAVQENKTNATLRVAYILADGGEAVTHIGSIDPTTGNFTSDEGKCQQGMLGNIAATDTGMYCASGGTIQPLPDLLP
jgi:hypothetical protein